jgi:hypothetical protein
MRTLRITVESVTAVASGPKAAFGTAKANVPGVLLRARLMYTAMVAAVALFPSPPVSMVAFLGLIEALELAQQGVATRAKGLGSLRNVKRNAVWTAMDSLRAYVQGLADVLDGNSAIALIETAGLLVAGVAGHPKPLLQVKRTTTPGVVHVLVNAGLLLGADASKKVTFNWQWSADGMTWSTVPSTPFADTYIENLALMTEYSFRVSATVGRVAGAWTDPVRTLVY